MRPEQTTETDAAVKADDEDAETITREEWLDLGWYGEGDPPAPEAVVREIRPEEANAVLVECLNERGFPATLTAEGGMSLVAEADQAQATAEAHYQCRAQYPPAPKYYQPYNNTQLRAWYDHLTTDVAPCLTELGYEIEPPPSQDTWIAGFGVTEGLWQPFDSVPAAHVTDVQEVCPPMPEDFYELASVPS